jgi:hypothetical protein
VTFAWNCNSSRTKVADSARAGDTFSLRACSNTCDVLTNSFFGTSHPLPSATVALCPAVMVTGQSWAWICAPLCRRALDLWEKALAAAPRN